MDPILDEYLKKKYLQDQATIDAENKKEADAQFQTNLSRGLNTISSGLSGVDLDTKGYDALDTQRQALAKKDKDARALVNDYMIQKYKLSKQEDDKAFEQKKFDESSRHNKAQEEQARKRTEAYIKGLDAHAKSAASKSAAKENPGEKALSEATGKEYADYISGGGSATSASHIKGVDDVLNELKNGEIGTAGFTDRLESAGIPGAQTLRKSFNPKGVGAQQKLENAIMGSLRSTLGAQFTENEGKRLLALSYDPALPTSENIKKIESLKTKLEQMAKAKEDAMKYFEANGSMRGYKGTNYAQPEQQKPKEESQVVWDDAKEKRLQELKQKLSK